MTWKWYWICVFWHVSRCSRYCLDSCMEIARAWVRNQSKRLPGRVEIHIDWASAHAKPRWPILDHIPPTTRPHRPAPHARARVGELLAKDRRWTQNTEGEPKRQKANPKDKSCIRMIEIACDRQKLLPTDRSCFRKIKIAFDRQRLLPKDKSCFRKTTAASERRNLLPKWQNLLHKDNRCTRNVNV